MIFILIHILTVTLTLRRSYFFSLPNDPCQNYTWTLTLNIVRYVDKT